MKYKSDKIYRLLFDHIGLERGDELTTKMVEEHLSEFIRASDDLKRIKADLTALEAANERLRAAINNALGWYQVTHIHAALKTVMVETEVER